MSAEYTFNMEDPRTWMPSTTVNDGYSAYSWLTKHLAMYDRLFYTVKNARITYGFQPFTLSKNTHMCPSWIRALTSHNDQIHKTVNRFKRGKVGIDEFITWIIPECGCLTIHIHNNQPTRLAYLSKSIPADGGIDHMVVFTKYLDYIATVKTPEAFIHAMQDLTLS